MANWLALKEAISTLINSNNNQEITGQILQSVLYSIITNVGENATFAGIARPDVMPVFQDGPVFYLATTAGVYSNFGGVVINEGEAVILEWNNGQWSKQDCGFATKEAITNVKNMFPEPLTQKQFDALEQAGGLVEGAYYNIYEDE